jgi:hypothetical protein
MAGDARAVRIPRTGPPSSAAAELPSEPSSTSGLAPSRVPPGERFPNTAGSSRAFRTFLFFLMALAAIYAVFLDFAVTSAASGTNLSVEGILTAAVLVSLGIGWFVTLGQTPSAAWIEKGQLVVHERVGRIRRYPTDSVRFHVLRSNQGGLLGPEATEFVEVSTPSGVRHTYLVGTHYFDFAQSRA